MLHICGLLVAKYFCICRKGCSWDARKYLKLLTIYINAKYNLLQWTKSTASTASVILLLQFSKAIPLVCGKCMKGESPESGNRYLTLNTEICFLCVLFVCLSVLLRVPPGFRNCVVWRILVEDKIPRWIYVFLNLSSHIIPLHKIIVALALKFYWRDWGRQFTHGFRHPEA